MTMRGLAQPGQIAATQLSASAVQLARADDSGRQKILKNTD